MQIGDPAKLSTASHDSLGSLIVPFCPRPDLDRFRDGSRHFHRFFWLSEAIAQTPAKQGHFSPQSHRRRRVAL
jgi:hypothetical protein